MPEPTLERLLLLQGYSIVPGIQDKLCQFLDRMDFRFVSVGEANQDSHTARL